MGKNAEESAGGTVNSIEPLQEMQHQLVKSSQIGLRWMGTNESRERDAVKNLRFELSMRSIDHSKTEFRESYLQMVV